MSQRIQRRFQQNRKHFSERFKSNLVKTSFNEQNFHEILRSLNKVLDSQKRRILLQGFQTLLISANSMRNKQLIYAAINKKNNTPKKQPVIGRKIRKQTKNQTIKKQTQEFFQFINDDISTIKNDTTRNDSITLQSRVDLDFFQQFGANRQNNFINKNQNIRTLIKQKERKNTQNQKQNFKSQISNVQSHSHQSYCRNLEFQKYDKNQIKLQSKKKLFLPNKTIFIQTKSKKESFKQSFQQIFIFRETSIKGKRHFSMPLNQQHKYFQIPLKSNNIKVFQYSTNSKKNVKSYRSLQTKNSTNACFENCQNSPLIDKCKYCSIILKANQIIKKIKSPQQF